MNAQKTHKFDWRQRMVAGIDLANDGPYPEQPIRSMYCWSRTIPPVRWCRPVCAWSPRHQCIRWSLQAAAWSAA
jgi:hypothetical protein